MRIKTDKIVRSWKASPEDMMILDALEKAKVERCESDRVRAGLRLLAKKRKACETNGNNNQK
jgi:hypothetical protein